MFVCVRMCSYVFICVCACKAKQKKNKKKIVFFTYVNLLFNFQI